MKRIPKEKRDLNDVLGTYICKGSMLFLLCNSTYVRPEGDYMSTTDMIFKRRSLKYS